MPPLRARPVPQPRSWSRRRPRQRTADSPPARNARRAGTRVSARLSMIEERQAAPPAAPHHPAVRAGQGPRVAEPVEHEQNGSPAGDRRPRARRGAPARGSPPPLRRRRGPRAPRLAIRRAGPVPREARRSSRHPALEAGSGAREEARAAFPADTLEDEVSRVRQRGVSGDLWAGSSSSTTTARPRRHQRQPRGRP